MEKPIVFPKEEKAEEKMRLFTGGATRDDEEGKLDFSGFLSSEVLEAYAKYMNSHRIQVDGKPRSSDNWKRGIPRDAYMSSAWRHFFAWWKTHQGGGKSEDHICALLFNAMGYLFEELKEGKKIGTPPK